VNRVRIGTWSEVPDGVATPHNPNFVDDARICGAYGTSVSAARDLDGALRAACAHDGPAVVEVMTDADLV
jgi:thiamine pyrophosphate-dependent acetolactate synthase large subunit-like protein